MQPLVLNVDYKVNKKPKKQTNLNKKPIERICTIIDRNNTHKPKRWYKLYNRTHITILDLLKKINSR